MSRSTGLAPRRGYQLDAETILLGAVKAGARGRAAETRTFKVDYLRMIRTGSGSSSANLASASSGACCATLLRHCAAQRFSPGSGSLRHSAAPSTAPADTTARLNAAVVSAAHWVGAAT